MAYFLLYFFFFVDKMHFKSPKLDGFKITVAKDGDTRGGILWCHSIMYSTLQAPQLGFYFVKGGPVTER